MPPARARRTGLNSSLRRSSGSHAVIGNRLQSARIAERTHMTQERFPLRRLALGGVVVGCLIAPLAAVARNPVSPAAQPPAAGRGGAQGPTVTSPEVRPDRRVTFRILAPDAQTVELRSPGDIPGVD